MLPRVRIHSLTQYVCLHLTKDYHWSGSRYAIYIFAYIYHRTNESFTIRDSLYRTHGLCSPGIRSNTFGPGFLPKLLVSMLQGIACSCRYSFTLQTRFSWFGHTRRCCVFAILTKRKQGKRTRQRIISF